MKYKCTSTTKVPLIILLCVTMLWTTSGMTLAQSNPSAVQENILLVDGLWAWGRNEFGELGYESGTGNFKIPTQVNGFDDVIDIAAGEYHSLVLLSDGTVWAWGSNDLGQLGSGLSYAELELSFTTVQVINLTDVIAIACKGGYHNVALKNDGTVWTWGSNQLGQLGIGTTSDSNSPVQVLGIGGNEFLTDIIAIGSGRHHSFAIDSSGNIFGWGSNNNGQLGDGTKTNRLAPVLVSGLNDVIAVDGGWYHSLAIKEDGTAWTWGRNNYGQLGDGTTLDKITPVQVKGVDGVGDLIDVTIIASGAYHNLAVLTGGILFAWGHNGNGRLGDGTTINRLFPVQTKGLNGEGWLTDVTALAAGEYHSLAIKTDGMLYAWGGNSTGQLGDGTLSPRLTPINSNALHNVSAIASGARHSIAVGSGNTPVGTNVTVNFVDQEILANNVSVTFDNVNTAGSTLISITSLGPDGPIGFSMGDPPVYYNIESTAEFSGSVTVCFIYPGVTETDRLFHYEEGAWVDVTTSVNPAESTICGVVTSFSPFVVATQDFPQIANTLADPNPAPVGSVITLSATIDDSETGGANIAWAEYSLDSGSTWYSMNGLFDSPTTNVTATIGVINEPQVVEILIQAADAYGNVSPPASMLLAVYDPSAGFVTGGGWIWSPEGAYAIKPELAGQATFGFVSRYKRGQSTPDGTTQFQFHAGDLNFRSTEYDWLVIAGSRAQFKGSGMINGDGNYGFLLTAIDGDLTQSQDFDGFRIKIWDKASGTIVYDNQMGMSDSDDSATELGGGSIVIHAVSKK